MGVSLVDSPRTSTFLVKSALYTTALGVVALAPFVINNFLQGRFLLGFGSGAVVLLCGINAWNCRHDRYEPLIILLGLAPAIIVFLWFAFRELGVIGALWSYPAVVSFYFILPGRYAWIANALLLGLVVPEAFDTFDRPVAIRYLATVGTTSVFAGLFVRYITRLHNELESLAITDTLTGLFNRVPLQRELERAIQQNHRTGSPMTILMMDLDHFKTINDSFGHDAGDRVLHHIGDYLNGRMRSTDLVFRVGGEEFLALLLDTALQAATAVAEEIRLGIEKLEHTEGRTVTASIGVAELEGSEDMDAWMKRADKNLYRAKSEGRNRVAA